MKAFCKENLYGRKGSVINPSPSFIIGKSYKFTDDTTVGHLDMPGDYKLINERGVVTIVSKAMFQRHFMIERPEDEMWII